MKKLGLIINPIAGMGGSVGLKGTDSVIKEALDRGAVPKSGLRARAALEALLPIKDDITVYTFAGLMGGDLAEELGFSRVILSEQGNLFNSLTETYGEDTKKLASVLAKENVDLILFAGGDGTARDVCSAIGLEVAALGIPAGVKIHSPVYARNPKSAGNLAFRYLTGKVPDLQEAEVLDIDEEEYRQERINTRLYGYLKIPKEQMLLQNRKSATPLSESASIQTIAYEIVDKMEKDVYYLIGAGTTTRGIMNELGLANTLLGVDLVCNGQLMAKDLYGSQIVSLIQGKKTKLIITITGGQGFLFGRGNQQLTPEVIRAIGKENIIIIATPLKLTELQGRPLLTDTGDLELDAHLAGYYRVVTGYGEYTMCKVSM